MHSREAAALRWAGVALVAMIYAHANQLAFLSAVGDVGPAFIRSALTACTPPCPLCLASDVSMAVQTYRPPLVAVCGRCGATFRVGADCRPDAVGVLHWQPLPDAGGHDGLPMTPPFIRNLEAA